MKEIRTEIEIEASPQVVWDILTDFEAYPAWNPCLVQVHAQPRPGSEVEMVFCTLRRRLHLNGRVLRADPYRELRWRGPISRTRGILFRGEHYWTIREKKGGSSSRLVHGELFSGLLIPAMSEWLDYEVGRAYRALNHSLKLRAESTR